MAGTGQNFEFQGGPAGLGWRILSLGGGIGFSLLIFTGISHARKIAPAGQQPVLEDLHAVALPLTPPPPPPEEQPPSEPLASPIQFDRSPADSPVWIEAVPVAIDSLADETVVRPANVHPSLAPHGVPTGLDYDPTRVWDRSEVDQVPVVLYRQVPDISQSLYSSVKSPRVTLLFIVKIDGTVENVHVIRSAGQAFDERVVDAIKQWQFTPAVKNGRKVRCWVQQPVYVRGDSSSPFEH